MKHVIPNDTSSENFQGLNTKKKHYDKNQILLQKKGCSSYFGGNLQQILRYLY